MRSSRLSKILAAALFTGVVASCDDPTRPAIEATIEPRIQLVQADAATRASLVLPLTEVRVRTFGPTGRVVSLTLQGGVWRGTVTGLSAGDYELVVEGIAAGQVQYYGRLPLITVARGQRAQPTVLFAPAVPVVTNPPLNNTTSFSQRVPFASIPQATGYVVQVSQDNTFINGVTEFTAADTNPLVNVTQPGTWFIRSRAILPQVPATSIPWSDVRTWVVIEADGGDNAGDAQPVTLTPETPQTLGERNLTPTKREDWFDIPAEAGDSVFAETFAARLLPFQSLLNTTLTLFESDGVTQVAQNLDATGTTDSRLVHVAATSETYKLRVGASNNTSGHYELITQIRRLPLTPESLVASIVSGTEVTLNWQDRSNNETSFRVERCLGAACNDFTEVGFTAPDVETFAQAGLTQGSTYRWRIRARNNVGNSVFTSEAVAALVGPAAPTALVATTLSNTSIQLAWTDVATNETGYEIQRCVAGAGCAFATITTVAADAQLFVDATAAYNTAYQYQVRATNNVVPSAFTAPVDANTIPPATPSALVAQVAGPTTINLSWTSNSANETHFLIERCLGDGCAGFTQIDSVGAGVTAYASTVAFNSAYRFRIRARNVVISQTYSGIAAADTRPPAVPTGLSATTQSGTSIALLWTDVADDETGYLVERCSSGAACTDFATVTTTAAGAAGYTDNGVSVNNSYRYRVTAVGIPGNSAASNIAAANTLVPAAPSGLSAQVITANVMRLTWTDNANNETGYTLRRCTGLNCTGFTDLRSFTAGVVTIDDSTTIAGQQYSYVLLATNIAGASAASNTSSANTLPPAVPSGASATLIGASQVDLAWTNGAGGVLGTRVERCTGVTCNNADFVEIDFVPVSNSTYSDVTIAAGNFYRYRLRAQNAADVSTYTSILDVDARFMSAPANAAVTVVNATPRITVTWDAATGPGLINYTIYRCEGPGCTNMLSTGNANAAATSYSEDVLLGTEYRYIVVAQNLVGLGQPSDTVYVNTLVPNAAVGLATELRPGVVRLTWTDNANNETERVIERCEGAGCGGFAQIDVVAADVTQYDDATAVAGTTYNYRVVTNNLLGSSGGSAPVAVTPFLPVAPNNLALTTAGPTQINLTWTDNSLNESGFEIRRCATDGCSNFAAIDSVGAGVTAFNDVTVVQGESYTYAVAAYAAFGTSNTSSEETATTRLPAAPTVLTATTLSSTSIRLNWTDNSDNETQFSVQKCTGTGCTIPAGNFVALPVNVTEYVDNSLSPNEEYSFHVFATNLVGNSAPTNVATAATNLPAIPAGLTITESIAPGDLEVFWTTVAGADGYFVERCEGVNCDAFSQVAVVAAPDIIFNDAGVTDGTTYRYRVAAFNAAGPSDFTTPIEYTAGIPAVPSGLVAAIAAGGTAVNLTWTDASNNEGGFDLERCAGVGCVDFAPIGGAAANEVSTADATVSVGQHYRYQIRASNGAGFSAYSNIVDAPIFLPDAPTVLSATTFSATQINLSWTDNGPYETGFEIQRCTGASCNGFAAVDTVPANVTTFDDAGLAQNLTFNYRVRAINAVGVSAFTNVVEAATDLPAAPTALAALAIAADQIDLAWTDNSDNETNFLLEFCEGVNCTNFAFLALIPPDLTSFQHTGLVADETYSYRIQAVGTAGSSPFAPVATTNTALPSGASFLQATTLSATRIDLQWDDNANNELGFIIERCEGVGCSNFALVDSVDAGVVAFSDVTVVVDVSYAYRLTAFNNVGVSAEQQAFANTLRPLMPSAFTASTVGASQIDLAWDDNSNNETGFVIERCVTTGCSTFDQLVVLGEDVTQYQDVGLSTSESFTYRITAINISGSSATAGPVTATTFVPAAPASLAGEPISASQIQLSWDDIADNELGYRIERCVGTGCVNFVEIGTVGADVTGFTSPGLVINTFYRHRVRAYNSAGTSAFTAALQTGTFAPSLAPAAFAALTITSSQVNLSWTDNATNEAGFVIQRCTTTNCDTFVDIDTVPAGATAYDDSNVPGGITVARYRVKAYNGVGSSPFSPAATASTVTPDFPVDFQGAVNGQTLASFTWTDVNSGETGYVIERCLGATCTDFLPVDTLGGDVQQFDDVGISGGNVYRYRIYSIGNGRSDFSPSLVLSTVLPADPTTLVAIPISNNRVTLSWLDLATDETAYVVERCEGASCTNFANVGAAAADATGFEDSSAPVGVELTYRVRAQNNAGVSLPSNEATVVTNIPAIPSDFSGVVSSATQIDLTWTNNATDETGIVVERCEGTSCLNFAPIDTAAADATSYSDLTALAGIVYRYRVRAINANGTSGATDAATLATTVPDAPTALTAVLPAAGSVPLQWNDVATNEVSYVVERCDGTGCNSFLPLQTLPANTQQYSDLTILVDTTYTYRVRAENAVGGSANAEFSIRTYRPLAPSTFTATTLSATAVQLDWTVADAGDASVITDIERCLGTDCTNFGPAETVQGDVFTFLASGLNASSLYRFQIRRRNDFGTLGYSSIVEASTDFPLPPDGLAAVPVSPSQIDLSWTDNSSNELFFIIERCTGEPCGGTFAVLDSVSANQVSFADLSVSIGQDYTYRVFARNGAGASDYSPTAGANLFLPEAGAGLTALPASPTRVDLTWTESARATRYAVRRCELAACTYAAIDTVVAATQYSDLTAVYGTEYAYVLVPLNVAGEGTVSNTAFALMLEPSDASALTAEPASPTAVTLTWSDNSANELWFRIERCEGAGCGDWAVVDSVPADVEQYVDGGVATDSRYEYQVTAVNNVGSAVPTPQVLVVMQAPAAPTILNSQTTGPGQITLGWDDNSDNELVFAIERCTGLTCTDFVQIDVVPANTLGYVNNGLSLNALYRYQVRALNNVGASAYTPTSISNTFLPAAPTTLTATTVNGARVDLSWVDASTNEVGFRIERCDTPGCSSFVVIAQVGANVTSFSNTGLTYGTSYNYRVRAGNISGDSPATNVATGSTTLPAPSAISVQALNRTQVQVSWSYPAIWQSGFQVVRCVGSACEPAGGVGLTGAGVLTLIDDVPVQGLEYTYSVRATTINGASAIGNRAVARSPIEMVNATEITGLSDPAGGRRNFAFTVPVDALALRVTQTQTGGDSDLNVKFGMVPLIANGPVNTPTECVPYAGGTAPEVCTFNAPAAGTWFSMMYGFGSYSNNTIKASLAERFGWPTSVGPIGGFGTLAVAHSFTVTEPISVTHLGAIVNGIIGVTGTRVAIYTNRLKAAPDGSPDPDQPDALLAQVDFANTAIGVNELGVSEFTLQPGKYWMASLSSTDVTFGSVGENAVYRYFADPLYVYATGFPAVWPAFDSFNPGYLRSTLFIRGFR